jgi:transposase
MIYLHIDISHPGGYHGFVPCSGQIWSDSMAKPYEMAHQFFNLAPNLDLLDSLYRKHQKAYIRTRLRAIRMLWEGFTRQDIVAKLDIGYASLGRWMRLLVALGVHDGLIQLVQPKKAPKTGKLTLDQQYALIEMIEHHTPKEFGYDQYIFTGAIVVDLVQQQWNMTISDQTVYNMLHRQRFSHQRGHRDYEPTDAEEQQAYGAWLKKSANHRTSTRNECFLTNSSLRIGHRSFMVGHAPIPASESHRMRKTATFAMDFSLLMHIPARRRLVFIRNSIPRRYRTISSS